MSGKNETDSSIKILPLEIDVQARSNLRQDM